jgi:biopolymer transport protein ExbD
MKGKTDDLITDINVTPLVDIILVILIIFLVVAQILGPQVLKVKLPVAAHGERENRPVTIYIDKEGRFYIEGAMADKEEIRRVAKKWMMTDPYIPFVVSADEGVPHGRVVSVLDLLKGEGVRRLAIHVQPK